MFIGSYSRVPWKRMIVLDTKISWHDRAYGYFISMAQWKTAVTLGLHWAIGMSLYLNKEIHSLYMTCHVETKNMERKAWLSYNFEGAEVMTYVPPKIAENI